MGYFTGLKDVMPSGGGSYMDEGVYKVRILEVKEKVSEQPSGGVAFIIEFTILESNNDKHKPGAIRSQYIGLGGKYPKMAMGDVKNFLCAAMGCEPEEIGEEEAEVAWSEDNPLEGVELKLVVIDKKNKQDPNKFFSKHFWKAVD